MFPTREHLNLMLWTFQALRTFLCLIHYLHSSVPQMKLLQTNKSEKYLVEIFSRTTLTQRVSALLRHADGAKRTQTTTRNLSLCHLFLVLDKHGIVFALNIQHRQAWRDEQWRLNIGNTKNVCLWFSICSQRYSFRYTANWQWTLYIEIYIITDCHYVGLRTLCLAELSSVAGLNEHKRFGGEIYLLCSFYIQFERAMRGDASVFFNSGNAAGGRDLKEMDVLGGEIIQFAYSDAT